MSHRPGNACQVPLTGTVILPVTAHASRSGVVCAEELELSGVCSLQGVFSWLVRVVG